MNRLCAAFVLLVACGLSACAQRSSPLPQPEANQAKSVAGADNPSVPFSLIISQELNDGKTLYVSGVLEARGAWNPRDAVVRLSTSAQGELSQEALFFPSDVLGSEHTSASEVPFALHLPASGVSDYQLQVLWGKEAADYIKPAAFAALLAQDTKLVHCAGQSCEMPRITARLLNRGDNYIDSAVLELDFGQAELALAQERLSLDKLSLAPGKSKLLRLTLDKQIDADKIARLSPQLRVISYVERR